MNDFLPFTLRYSYPTTRLDKLKVETHYPDVLTKDEVQYLLSVIPETFSGLRNRTMILTLLDTGIRLRELMGMTVVDLELKTLTLKVFGKGRKERYVPFSPTLARMFTKYFPQRELYAGAYEPALWIGESGKPLNYYYLHDRLQYYGKAAKLTRPVHPHLFRHTFATEYLRNGGNPQMLQRILGHRS